MELKHKRLVQDTNIVNKGEAQCGQMDNLCLNRQNSFFNYIKLKKKVAIFQKEKDLFVYFNEDDIIIDYPFEHCVPNV